MERVAMGGLTLHGARVADLEGLEAWGAGADEARLRELADGLGASELVLLATCNRLELVYAREAGQPPGLEDLPGLASALGAGAGLSDRLHLWTGRRAVRHLFRVACSLDSVVRGEDQILAQVRAAFRASEELGLTGPLLEPLFEAAFQVGKEVRTRTELSRHAVSVLGVGVTLLAERLQALRVDATRPATAVVLGAGEGARLAARALADHGLRVARVVNRTRARAEALAAEHGAQASTFEEFLASDEPFDTLVACTGAPGCVVDGASLARFARDARRCAPLVALDLALPRDLEPVELPELELLDLDDVRARASVNRARRAAAAEEAEAWVERKLQVLERRKVGKRLDPWLEGYVVESQEYFERQLRALVEGPLGRLGEQERRAVERWARSTFGRLNHRSIAACKELVEQGAAAPGTRAATGVFEEEETTG